MDKTTKPLETGRLATSPFPPAQAQASNPALVAIFEKIAKSYPDGPRETDWSYRPHNPTLGAPRRHLAPAEILEKIAGLVDTETLDKISRILEEPDREAGI